MSLPGRIFDSNGHLKCDAAVKILQSKLTSAPILGYPDFTKPFIIDTDASDLSPGAVLSQVEDGKERVLCYDGITY